MKSYVYFFTLVILLLFHSIHSFSQVNHNECACEFKFNAKIYNGDSIAFWNKEANRMIYLNSQEYDSVLLYLNIDKRNKGWFRVGELEAFIYYKNDEIGVFEHETVDSLANLFENLWIISSDVHTALSEWTFGIPGKRDSINQLFIYAYPTTESERTFLNANNWLVIEEKTYYFTYNIKVLDCKGKWAKIQLKTSEKNYEGWMPWYNLCRSVLTLCHHLPEDGVKNEK